MQARVLMPIGNLQATLKLFTRFTTGIKVACRCFPGQHARGLPAGKRHAKGTPHPALLASSSEVQQDQHMVPGKCLEAAILENSVPNARIYWITSHPSCQTAYFQLPYPV